MAIGNVISDAIFTSSMISNVILRDFLNNMINLGIYVGAIVIYAIIVWVFYRHLGKRIIFTLDIPEPEGYHRFFQKIWRSIEFLFTSLVLFPVISFIWFIVLSAFLLFLSKSQDVNQILLMAMTLIAASRITAYYNEDLSRDLAKMIPLYSGSDLFQP